VPHLPKFELGYPRTELRRKLVEAALRGDKTATAGLASDHVPHTDEPLPKAGDRWLLVGYDDEPLAVVETTEVRLVPAGEIDLRFAREEGEGFESVADWRAAHERFWSEHRITDDTLIVAERFRLLERRNHAMSGRCHHPKMTAFIRRDRLAREEQEERLAPAASRSAASRGRRQEEPPDDFRTSFERDRDRILHSKAFRRLKHKTQVFINPEGDHFVTRLTHTVQVTQIARALAAALSLNEPLAEAIALGHDVGHSPFGHTGEEALSPYFPGREWHHAAQSVRIFEVLEDLNLTWEVRDGIRAHSWKIEPPPATPEALCVRYADRIAYLTHDALDALRAGVLSADDFPAATRTRFGEAGRVWIDAMINAVIDESLASGELRMDSPTLAVMNELRDFMFERVYLSEGQRLHTRAAIDVISRLIDYHLDHPDQIPATYRDTGADQVTQVVDYVAGMTDRYALMIHDRLFGLGG
jgi:dGTPase